MSGLWALTRFEFSRHRFAIIGAKSSNPAMVLLVGLLAVGTALYCMKKPMDPYFFFFTATVFSFNFLLIYVWFQELKAGYSEQREWWLTIPHHRSKLILAKWYAYCGLGLLMVLYMLGIESVTYWIAKQNHWILPVDGNVLFRILLANAWLAIVSVPAATGFGILVLAFVNGWRRVIGLVYTLLVLNGPFLGWSIFFHEYDRFHLQGFLMPGRVLEYSMVTVILGWTASYLCIRFTANSLRRWGAVRYPTSGLWLWSQATVKKNVQPSRFMRTPLRHPFWSLVALEYARFRVLWKRIPGFIRLIDYGILLALAIGGYFSASSLDGLVNLPLLLFEFCLIATLIIQTSMSQDFQKGWGIWWLTMPQSRFVLLGGRVFGQYFFIFGNLIRLLSSLAIGIFVHWLLYGIPTDTLLLAAHYWRLMSLLFLVLSICTSFLWYLLPVIHRLPKGFQILALPIGFSYFFSTQFLLHWILPEGDLRQGPLTSYWFHLKLLMVIGVPLAIICFLLGAKYLHSYLYVQFPDRLTGKRKSD